MRRADAQGATVESMDLCAMRMGQRVIPQLPRWGWLAIAIIAGLLALPLYLRWFVWASGGCSSARLLQFLAPRIG